MDIRFKTKEKSGEKHDYSFIVRLNVDDFEDKIIRELVLKIRAPIDLNWKAGNENIKTKREEIGGREYSVFEIRRHGNLYPQDMPLEIIGPESSIGEILYSVTDDNCYLYRKNYLLLWGLYGEGVKAQHGDKKLEELQNF